RPIGGIGDFPQEGLHALEVNYRFFFNPIRYTSLPLAVIEAMMLGLPVVALATTELPTVIVDGVNGYVSNDLDYLVGRMWHLIEGKAEAERLGANAKATALERFGLPRFIRDWDAAFREVTD
ncbi:MAG: glycosyltransferase, partial [Chloroflexi bacterium]|nr:glycosyltransferase [Chloroflexota bacterium]